MTNFFTSDQECISRQINKSNTVTFDEDIDDKYDILDTCDWITENNFQKICLQFPDELLCYSTSILQKIKNKTKCEIYILGDTSYGSCCVDEVAARHVGADCLVHYGHSCFSPSSLPVKYISTKLPLNDYQVVQQIKDKFNDGIELAMLCDFSFLHVSDKLYKKILEHYPNALLGKLKDYSFSKYIKGQLIDSKNNEYTYDKLKNYECIYIGNNMQKMFNLTITVQAKKWYSLNTNNSELLPSDEIKWFMRRRYLMELCKDAKNIGILICTLSVQRFLDIVNRIKIIIKNCGKRSYIISVGKPNVAKLANLSEIDIFVLIACPENELYSSKEFYKPLIYPCELESALSNQVLPMEPYVTNFTEILSSPLNLNISNEVDVSLITGQVRNFEKTDENVTISGVNDLQQINMALASAEIGSNLRNKTWQGLEQKLGGTEVKHVEIGRSGTTLAYANENEL